MSKPFQEQTFYYCYDCGYGERGVTEYCLTFQQAYDIIKDVSCVEVADRFATEEESCFDFHVERYMCSEEYFRDEDWEGSDDY